MKQYLVRSSSNWADEIDFEGWEIMNEKELAEAKAEVKAFVKEDFSADVYVGTNEEMEVEASEVLDELNKAKEITPEEAAILKKFFGDSYGFSLYNKFINSYDVERYYEEIEEEKKEKEKQKKINDRFAEVKGLFKE